MAMDRLDARVVMEENMLFNSQNTDQMHNESLHVVSRPANAACEEGLLKRFQTSWWIKQQEPSEKLLGLVLYASYCLLPIKRKSLQCHTQSNHVLLCLIYRDDYYGNTDYRRRSIRLDRHERDKYPEREQAHNRRGNREVIPDYNRYHDRRRCDDVC